MKKLKTFLIAMMIVAPLLIPTPSKAGGLDGVLNWIDHLFANNSNNNNGNNGNHYGQDKDKDKDKDPKTSSAPIDGGLVVLLGAGAALGVTMLYKRRVAAH